MRNYLLHALLFIFSYSHSVAQEGKKTKSEKKFAVVVQVGLLEGSAEKSYGQFQVLSGIQDKTWFYGLGLGIDYYGSKRSVPLFFDVRKDLMKGKRTPFVYADAGYNFSWLRDGDKINNWGNDYKQTGGAYYDAGLGYKFALKNKMAIGISAGYSYKQQKEMFSNSVFSSFVPFPGDGTEQHPEIYEYEFRRISLKLTCSF